MAFSVPSAVAADADNIQIQLPASGDRDWGTNLRDLCFVKLANHDHSGSGKGKKLPAGSIAASSVTGAEILLNNDTYLKWKDSAGSAVNVMKLNATGGGTPDNRVEIDVDIDKLIMSNNVSLQADNAAGTVRSMAKLTSSDAFEFGDSNEGQLMRLQKETLADNQSATAVPDFAVLGTDESAFIMYSMDRGTDCQMGTLWIDQDNTNLIEECAGDSVGVTFTNNAGQLEYATTSTGTAVTAKFFVIRG